MGLAWYLLVGKSLMWGSSPLQLKPTKFMKPKFIGNKIMSIELVSRNISQSQNACRNISQSKGKIKDQYKQTNILKQFYNTTYCNRTPLINEHNNT